MKTPVKIFLIVSIILISCNNESSDLTTDKDYLSRQSSIPEWFRDGKFGMFIHWGPYSVLGGEWNGKRIKQGDNAEWIMQKLEIPVDEYRKIAVTFNPVDFDAEEWVALAKKAGMKYIIITSKHHDGFAMYDSEVSNYNIVDYTPYGRDPLKELSEACAKAGIRFCIYYSHREDWEHPYAYGNTWGYSKHDNNWKQAEEIIRRMVTIISKGGNYLLNVGPTGEGIIPQPSVEILSRAGKWMDKNSESIYGTSSSPFTYELPWGFCTRKGNLLYLHVFDWPEDGILEVEGLYNDPLEAYLLINKEKQLDIRKESNNKLHINLPESPPDYINTVVVLKIKGKPVVKPFVIVQNEYEPVSLDYLTANTSGRAVKRFNRKGEEKRFHISKMQGPDDIIEWHVNFKTPGLYNVLITYAAIEGWDDGRYIIQSGKKKISGPVISTQAWYKYKTEQTGQLNITKPGLTTIRLYSKEELDHYLMYFSEIELVPVKMSANIEGQIRFGTIKNLKVTPEVQKRRYNHKILGI